ncbi:hypothetical protein D3C85_1388010 [compost metagenome]
MPGLDPDFAAGRLDAARVHGHAVQTADLFTVVFQALGPGQIKQLAAVLEGRWNAGDQHRLLGVDRATHAAIAQVPAAAHVARDHLPVVAQRFAAAA